MTFREILKEHRISQAEFGRMLKIPTNTLSQWSLGKREPQPYLLELIAYYLDHELGVPACRENNQTK